MPGPARLPRRPFALSLVLARALPRLSLFRSLSNSALAVQKPLEVRVLVSNDGRLICKDLPSGSYTVAAWRTGADTRTTQALSEVPNCSIDNSKDCGVFCTLTAAGDLVCEGLTEGTYTVLAADPSLACSFSEEGVACVGDEAPMMDGATRDALQKPRMGSFGG